MPKMDALEGWEFGDPFEVACRRESRAKAKAKRQARDRIHKQRRIRALVAKVMRRAA